MNPKAFDIQTVPIYEAASLFTCFLFFDHFDRLFEYVVQDFDAEMTNAETAVLFGTTKQPIVSRCCAIVLHF